VLSERASPQTLLSSSLRPMPETQTRADVENDYNRLYGIEMEMPDFEQQVDKLRESSWPS